MRFYGLFTNIGAGLLAACILFPGNSGLTAAEKADSFVNHVMAKDSPPVNMLFWGNSFTLGGAGYYTYRIGGVARLVREIAIAEGYQAPNIQLTASNGVSIKFHYDTNRWTITGKNSDKPKDFVMPDGDRYLRFTGPGPGFNSEMPEGFKWDYISFCQNDAGALNDGKEFVRYGVMLFDEIRKHSPNAKLIVYEPWARHCLLEWAGAPVRFQEKLGPAAWELVTEVNAKYPASAAVSPAGEAWYELGFPFRLYANDMFHGDTPGYFMNAMVIFRTVYGGYVSEDKMKLICDNYLPDMDSCTLKALVKAANSLPITPFADVPYSAEPSDFISAYFKASRERQNRKYADSLKSYEKAASWASNADDKARALRGIGDCLTGMKDFAKARVSYASILKLDGVSPDSIARAQNSIGASYLEEGKKAEAAAEYLKVLEIKGISPTDFFDNAYIAAELLKQRGKRKEAFKVYMDIIKAGEQPSFFILLGINGAVDYMLCEGRDSDALEILESYRKYTGTRLNIPHYFGIQERIAAMYSDMGEYGKAAAAVEEWINSNDPVKNPGFLGVGSPLSGGVGKGWLLIGDIWTKAGKYDEAEKAYEKVFELENDAFAKYDLGIPDKGTVEMVRSLVPLQKAQANIGLARIASLSGNIPGVRLYADKIAADNSLTPDLKAEMLAKTACIAAYGAIKQYSDMALAVKDAGASAKADVYFKLIDAANMTGSKADAIGYHESINSLKGLPDDKLLVSLCGTGDYYLSKRKLQKAFDAYRRALSLNVPKHLFSRPSQGVNAVANAYANQEFNPEKAASVYLEFMNMDGSFDKMIFVQGLNRISDSYLKAGEPERAIELCRRIFGSKSELPKQAYEQTCLAAFRVAKYYESLKKQDKAKGVYSEIKSCGKASETSIRQAEDALKKLDPQTK